MKKQHFEWIDYAKGIAILLVVIGHSFPDASMEGGVRNIFLRGLHDVIYQFHMPLMFFISGMLSGKILRLASLGDRVVYLRDRFLRLMVPYFVIALLYLPFKILLSRFANQPYDISGIWEIMLGENPDGGLWFLYVLFLIQVAMCFIVRKHNLRFSLVISMLLAVLITYLDTKWYRVDDALLYLCFTVAGLYYTNSSWFDKKIELPPMIILAVLLAASLWVFIKTESPYCRLVSGYLGTFVVIGIAKNADAHSVIGRFFTMLGKYTMDIYIFHGILMVMARIVFFSLLGLNYYLCCVIMLLVGLVLPILISKYIVRRVYVMRALLLGDFKKNK